MKRLSVATPALFAAIKNNEVKVSAFSPTHPRIIPSSIHSNIKQQIHPHQFRRNDNVNHPHPGKYRLKCTQASSSNGDDAAAATSNTNDISTYFNNLLSQFQGDFDNYNQVLQDRRHGLPPGAGGGHEHIHCTLVPCPPPHHDTTAVGNQQQQPQPQWVLAAFYFNGNPRQIFRFRAYQLSMPPSSSSSDDDDDDEIQVVRMKLHTLSSDLEGQLRQCSEEPCTWWKQVWNVWRNRLDEKEVQHDEGILDVEEWNEFQTTGMATLVTPLEGCDVLWDPNWDPSDHSYLYTGEYDDDSETDPAALPPGQSCHATMEAGSKGAIVDSISMIPGKRILIKDELSLWKDEFWINDRGYDPDEVLEEKENDDDDGIYLGDGEGMPFVYGNRRGVPYKLQKVSDIQSGSRKEEHPSSCDNIDVESVFSLERVIANSDLEWTLGDEFRTSELYQEKTEAVDKAME